MLFRKCVSGFELTENLRLANHHGVQTCCDAEQMPYGVAIFVAIEIRRHPIARHLTGIGQKLIDVQAWAGTVFRSKRHLHTIAGRENNSLAEAGAALQFNQSLQERAVVKSETLAHFHWGRLVIHAGDGESHLANMDLSPTCAAQVRAEQQRTATAISAALRPLHPALARKKTIIR